MLGEGGGKGRGQCNYSLHSASRERKRLKRNVETSGSRDTQDTLYRTEVRLHTITSTDLKNVLFLQQFLTIIIHKTTNCKALYEFCTFHSFPFTTALQETLWEKQMELHSSFSDHPAYTGNGNVCAVWVQVPTRIWHGKVQLLTAKPIQYRLDSGILSVCF